MRLKKSRGHKGLKEADEFIPERESPAQSQNTEQFPSADYRKALGERASAERGIVRRKGPLENLAVKEGEKWKGN